MSKKEVEKIDFDANVSKYMMIYAVCTGLVLLGIAVWAFLQARSGTFTSSQAFWLVVISVVITGVPLGIVEVWRRDTDFNKSLKQNT